MQGTKPLSENHTGSDASALKKAFMGTDEDLRAGTHFPLPNDIP